MNSAIVVGLGRMGMRHIQALDLLEIPIAGVVELSDKRISEVKAEFPHLKSFSSLREALSVTSANIVVIATTAPAHAELTINAAEFGAKFIFVEKPMATSVSDCKKMIEVCKKHGAKLAVNHQMRYMQQYQVVRELQAEYSLGPLRSMAVHGGNMGMSMNAVHYIEAFRWLFAEEILSAYYFRDEETLPNPRGEKFSDTSGQLVAFSQSGARLLIDIGNDRGHGLVSIYGFRNAMLEVDELEGYARLYSRNKIDFDLPTSRYGCEGFSKLMQVKSVEVIESTASVLSAMLSNESFPDGQNGLEAVRVIAMAELSADKGSNVMSKEIDESRSFPWA